MHDIALRADTVEPLRYGMRPSAGWPDGTYEEADPLTAILPAPRARYEAADPLPTEIIDALPGGDEGGKLFFVGQRDGSAAERDLIHGQAGARRAS